ncbi:hypothetical protein I6A84_21900 [Frankia sp. CNm7]|uniref:Uncharacterized protein n=1 Tax=Frankia nepalensis TaxID=1836974 RepID=A0A937RB11_9ACTN|nr:hypothetical protein [Frankia nepalensis]MBL7500403.1 hypothetical protein [Frankia nepalensis]MBL7508701.1 hypothetical protein [Frankia nepalensis]MBL7520665.1 hypothetical protein [Frankia nepalensis]MBL7628863.1 hypothetical protein [Frankia nepalensis]
MDFAALDARLTVTNGVFVLAANTLPDAGLAELLARNNAGQPIRVTQAVKQRPKRVGSGSRDSIPITGVATFLNVPDLRVEALFSLDDAGNPVFLLRFELETRTGPERPFGWRFSTSFPTLPAGKSGPAGGSAAPTSGPATPAAPGPLDGLTLSNATFVLTNRSGMDGRVPVSAGLNFVSRVDPAPLLGPLGPIVGDVGKPTLYGPVHLPLPTEVTPPLPPGRWPWEADLAPVPGLTLRVDVGRSIAVPGVNVNVRDTEIVLYSPISEAWLEANPTYQPSVGLTGTLSAPAFVPAPILLTADIPFGWSSATLSATFTDASLANLTGLGGLFGRSDLFAALPAPLRAAGQALGGISLRLVAFHVTAGDRGLTLDAARAVVELPTLRYAVGDLVTLAAPRVTFLALPPASGSGGLSTSVMIGGTGTIPALGAAFELDVDVTQGVAYGSLADATLPLRRVFDDLALPAPADLVIDAARISIAPGEAYELNATIAEDVPWTLDLGPVPVSVRGIVLVAMKIVGEPASASLAGRIRFGSSLEIAALYELPGDFVITGTFGPGSLGDLVTALTDAEVTLPAGFDLEIEQGFVCVDSVAGGLRFTATALIDGFGALAFTASRRDGRWRFAAGLNVTEGLVTLESVPGLGALAELRALVGLTDLMIVVSSLDDPGFTFPELAVPPPPDLGGPRPALPAQATGVGAGLTVYGRADLGASRAVQTIARWLDVDIAGTAAVTLVVSAPDPGAGSRLFVSVATTVDGIVVTGRLGLGLVNRRPEVFLDGTALVTLQGQPVLFSLAAAVAANGVLISGGYRGTIHFDLGAGLGGFTLSNLGLVVGLSWEGIPAFGVAATIDARTFSSSVAVFFDSTDPSRSLLAGSVTELSLYDVVATIAGQTDVAEALAVVLREMALRALDAFTLDAAVVAALDGRDLAAVAAAFAPRRPVPSGADQVLLNVGEPGRSWHLTDLTTMTHFSLAATGAGVEVSYDPQLYCAPNDTQIGPNRFPRGFHIQTAIEFLLFDLDRLWVEISPARGIAADAMVAPIVVGHPDLFSITNAARDGGPTLSLATYTRSAAEQPDPELRPPHVLVSGALRLLGTDFGSVHLNVSESGVTVRITATVGGGVRVDLAGSVTREALRISGTLAVGVGGTIDLGPLGRIDVTTQARGTLEIEFARDSLSATVRVGVTLPGLGSLTLPPIHLTVSGVPLGEIGSVIWSEIIETVVAAVQDATRWVGFVRDGLIKGIEGAARVAEVLAEQWNLAADAVGDVLHDAGYTANQVAEGMRAVGATAEDVARTLVDFGYATDIVNSAVGIFGGHTDFVAGHFDIPGGFHTDGHADFGLLGGGHVDERIPPHTDSRIHVDT